VRSPAAIALMLAVALAGCGGGSHATTETTATADRVECTLLLARLQRVTVALQASSELIAHSLNPGQLSARIAIEEVQLRGSAQLIASGTVPARLEPAVDRLASALVAFSRDFARAKAPATRGDLATAVSAMTDEAVVQRIVSASKEIEDACR
jgi:hypothetical protein